MGFVLTLCVSSGEYAFDPEFAIQTSPDVGREERVRLHGTGFEFRMELTTDEPGMIRQFDHLHQLSVRGQAAGL